MAAKGERGRPFKTLHPKPPRVERVRLGLELMLTPSEVEQLKATAAADMRSISAYIGFLVSEDLRRRQGGRRPLSRATWRGKDRADYTIKVSLTPDQKEQLQVRASEQVRSVSNYVTRLILDYLQRG
ncbi:hypothetical protein N9166_00065 [bacterium]|nr:hypothetical protein [bacterium]MDB4433115.1 hypothetical protein [bacterium]